MLEGHFTKKVLVALAIIVTLVVISLFAFSIFYGQVAFGGSCIPELSIGILYNSTTKSLDLNITSMVNKTITFQQLAIIDSKNSVLFKDVLPSIELLPKENITISRNIGEAPLCQGNSYNIELLSTNRQKYQSSLIIFERIEVTNVSCNSPNTLLIQANSLANQTLFFDHATIYQWKEQESSTGVKSQVYATISEGTLSPNQLLPNQNTTVTISLSQEVATGSYDLWLSYVTPPYVRGGERVPFTVVG